MGCLYSNFQGECTLKDHDRATGDPVYCVWEEDPDPSYGCESYESDEDEGG